MGTCPPGIRRIPEVGRPPVVNTIFNDLEVDLFFSAVFNLNTAEK